MNAGASLGSPSGSARDLLRSDYAHALVDHAGEALIAISPYGEVLSWNQAATRLLGFPSNEAVGRLLYDLVVPRERLFSVRAAIRGPLESASSIDTVLRRKDGALVEVEIRATAVPTNGAAPAPRAIPFPAHSPGDPSRGNEPLAAEGTAFIALHVRDVSGRRHEKDESKRLLEGERRARVDAETAQKRYALLAEASRLLSGSLDLDVTLKGVAHFIVPVLGDFCAIDLVEEASPATDGRDVADPPPRRVELACSDRTRESAIRTLLAGSPARILKSVLARGEPEVLPGIPGALEVSRFTGAATASDPLAPQVPPLRSLVVAPLTARGRVFGAFTIGVFEPRGRLETEDIALLFEIARRTGVAIENARLFLAERRALAEAEAGNRRMAALADASQLLATSLDYGAPVAGLPRRLIPVLADFCALEVVDEGGARRLEAAHVEDGKAELVRELLLTYPPEAGDLGDVDDVLRVGELGFAPSLTPEKLASRARDARHLRLLTALNPRSWIHVPLVARGRLVGRLTLAQAVSGRTVATDDLTLAREVARRAALALENARLFEAERKARARAEEATRAREESLRALRENEDRLARILEAVTEGILIMDVSFGVVFVNAAAERFLKRQRRDILGRIADASFWSLSTLEGEPLALADLPFRRTVETGEARRELTYAMRRADGENRIMSMNVAPLRSEEGAVTGVVVSFSDVTDRARADEELSAARREVAMSEKMSALGSLVSGVAHEIRTPLTFIANNLFMIRHRLEKAAKLPEAPAATRALVDEVLPLANAGTAGVDRINRLVTDLRRFTQLKLGDRAPVALHDVVGEAVELFRATHRGHVAVRADLKPTPAFELDKVKIQQVVLNLLDNAADALGKGGTVRVSTTSAEGRAGFTVEDDGPGIPPEVQRRMFEPFFTTKPEGTGLGLSIVRRIVEEHGGSITCETAPAKGSRFTVALPTTPRTPLFAGAGPHAAPVPIGPASRETSASDAKATPVAPPAREEKPAKKRSRSAEAAERPEITERGVSRAPGVD